MNVIIRFYLLIFILLTSTPSFNSQAVALDFSQIDPSVTNAMEIAAQGTLTTTFVYILKTDNSLHKLIGATFQPISSPVLKIITKISVTEQDVLHSCTADYQYWIYNGSSSTWSGPIATAAHPNCYNLQIGYGPNSRLVMGNNQQTAVLIGVNYYLYWNRYNLSGQWTYFSYAVSYATNDDGQTYFIINSNMIFYLYSRTYSASTGHPLKFQLNSVADLPAQDTTDISHPTGNLVYLAYNGIIYKIDDTCLTLAACYIINSDKLATRIRVPRWDLPWIIGNNGKIYHASCTAPNDFYDQKNLICRTSSSCPPDTIVDSVNKRCNFVQMFGFAQKDLSITNASEIETQGQYVFITKTDGTLWKWNGLSFISHAIPATKTLSKITISEKILYACTTDRLMYQLDISTAVWSPIVLTGGMLCQDTATGYGPLAQTIFTDFSNRGCGIDPTQCYFYMRRFSSYLSLEVWKNIAHFTNLSSSDDGGSYVTQVNGGNCYLYLIRNGGWTLVMNLIMPGYGDSSIMNNSTDLSNPTGNYLYMVFKGVLYRNDTSVYTWVQDITKMKPLEYFKNFAKVSAPRYDLPWFIDYSGKIWQAFCNAPYDYWDQKQLNCVPSTSCHVDTVVDAPTKTCIYNQVFGFTQISTVTNALEISAQGSYLIILKADFSLWKWDTTTSTFISLPVDYPSIKFFIKITIITLVFSCSRHVKNSWTIPRHHCKP